MRFFPFLAAFALLMQSCLDKDIIKDPLKDPAAMHTDSVSHVGFEKVLIHSTLSSVDPERLVEAGITWGPRPSPIPAVAKIPYNNVLGGNYVTEIPGLTSGSTYYVRTYALSAGGIFYGNELEFVARKREFPSLATNPADEIQSSQALCGGNVSSAGSSAVSERGIEYTTTPNDPGNVNQRAKAATAGTGQFSVLITGLSPSTQYYARAYALNGEGAGYGPYISFTTLP